MSDSCIHYWYLNPEHYSDCKWQCLKCGSVKEMGVRPSYKKVINTRTGHFPSGYNRPDGTGASWDNAVRALEEQC